MPSRIDSKIIVLNYNIVSFLPDYPCPLISVRNRKPVFFEIGHTIMNLLADFRNFQYMLPQIKGVTIHMEDKKTIMNFPRNRYDEVDIQEFKFQGSELKVNVTIAVNRKLLLATSDNIRVWACMLYSRTPSIQSPR